MVVNLATLSLNDFGEEGWSVGATTPVQRPCQLPERVVEGLPHLQTRERLSLSLSSLNARVKLLSTAKSRVQPRRSDNWILFHSIIE